MISRTLTPWRFFSDSEAGTATSRRWTHQPVEAVPSKISTTPPATDLRSSLLVVPETRFSMTIRFSVLRNRSVSPGRFRKSAQSELPASSRSDGRSGRTMVVALGSVPRSPGGSHQAGTTKDSSSNRKWNGSEWTSGAALTLKTLLKPIPFSPTYPLVRSTLVESPTEQIASTFAAENPTSLLATQIRRPSRMKWT